MSPLPNDRERVREKFSEESEITLKLGWNYNKVSSLASVVYITLREDSRESKQCAFDSVNVSLSLSMGGDN